MGDTGSWVPRCAPKDLQDCRGSAHLSSTKPSPLSLATLLSHKAQDFLPPLCGFPSAVAALSPTLQLSGHFQSLPHPCFAPHVNRIPSLNYSEYCKDHVAIFKTNKQKPLSSEGLVIGKKKEKYTSPQHTHTHTHTHIPRLEVDRDTITPRLRESSSSSRFPFWLCVSLAPQLADTSWLGAAAYTISRL